MTATGPGQHSASQYRKAGILLALAIALLAVTAFYMIGRDGLRIWATARQNTLDGAMALEIAMTDMLEQSTYSVAGVSADLRNADRPSHDDTLLLLRNAMRFDPLSAYLGVKLNGKVVAVDHDTRPARDSVAKVLEAVIPDTAPATFRISNLIQVSDSGAWYMPVILGVESSTGNSGRPRAVAFALVPAGRLEAVLSSLRLLPGSSVTFISADGRRLISYNIIRMRQDPPPYNGGQIPDWVLKMVFAHPSGSTTNVSPVSKRSAIFGWSSSPSVPFLLAIGIPEHLLYTQWLHSSLAPALVLFIGTLAICIFGIRLRSALQYQQQYLETQEYLASHDSLTGLLARDAFMHHLNSSIEQFPAHEFAVILLDLNNFKDINDTLGHAAGDEVLKMVAVRLTTVLLDRHASIARLGGDELGICIAKRAVPESLEVFCAGIQLAIGKKIFTHGVGLETAASMGAAVYPHDAASPVELLRRADIAMYAAKTERKTFSRYIGSMDIFTAEALVLRGEFAQAIRDGELWIAYQPKVDLNSGELVGLEALARWNHPTRGPIPPAQFVPFAEATELIYPFTDFVLRTTMAQAAKWLAQCRAVPIAVNISANNLLDDHFAEKLAALLDEFRVPPEFLELEITESAVMRHPDLMVKRLQKIRILGVKLSIDDFGTGYASLSYLKKLPVATLKIDRSFIADLERDDADRRIVKSSISLGHEFGMTVVAEGVETSEVAALLREFHCDIAQGYHFGRPMAAREIEATWLQHRLTGLSSTAGPP